MDCSVCGKLVINSASASFNCACCVRSTLYPFRIQHARTLIEREALAAQIETIIPIDNLSARKSSGSSPSSPHQPSSPAPFPVDQTGCASHLAVEDVRAETARVNDRIDGIMAQSELLRRQLEEGRAAIKARKKALQKSRDEQSAALKELTEKRKDVTNLQNYMNSASRRIESQRISMEHDREFLAREAARLAGLKMRRKREKDGNIREEFLIGGLKIPDLRDLNAARKSEQLAQLSASLTHVAYLLVRVSNYLSVRLPCEIILPQKNYPLPTIFNLPSSHLGIPHVAFPGNTPYQSSSTSPDASRSDLRYGAQGYHGPPPRPRLLAIDQSLPELSKDDPPRYRLFIEAIILLAWDAAWLCQSQGLGPFKQWEEICPMGRNLYQLLIVKPAGSSTAGNATTSHGNSNHTPGKENLLGKYSHGNANGFLGAAISTGPTQDPFRGWKLTTPTRAIDRLRSHLLLEMQGAEWEVLDEGDYAGAMVEMQEEGILVGGARTGNNEATAGRNQKEGIAPASAKAVQESAGSSATGTIGTKLQPRISVRETASSRKPSQDGGTDGAGAGAGGGGAEISNTQRPARTNSNGWMKVRERS